MQNGKENRKNQQQLNDDGETSTRRRRHLESRPARLDHRKSRRTLKLARPPLGFGGGQFSKTGSWRLAASNSARLWNAKRDREGTSEGMSVRHKRRENVWRRRLDARRRNCYVFLKTTCVGGVRFQNDASWRLSVSSSFLRQTSTSPPPRFLQDVDGGGYPRPLLRSRCTLRGPNLGYVVLFWRRRFEWVLRRPFPWNEAGVTLTELL